MNLTSIEWTSKLALKVKAPNRTCIISQGSQVYKSPFYPDEVTHWRKIEPPEDAE